MSSMGDGGVIEEQRSPLPSKSATATGSSGGAGGRAAVRDFVRTPLAVRRNVVKVWREIPPGVWTELSEPSDRLGSIRRERQAVLSVALMAVMLVAGFSGIGLRATVDGDDLCFPLLGRSMGVPAGAGEDVLHGPGDARWYYIPGQSLNLALWVVAPSLLGWVFVRVIWIPTVAAKRPTRAATVTFARHLGAVYLYVYLMILAGVSLMPLLIFLSPRGTETLRWWLWCFLFGESFFVPAVMWSRLVIRDSFGQVFGRFRYAVLVLYLLLFIVVPIAGMLAELD